MKHKKKQTKPASPRLHRDLIPMGGDFWGLENLANSGLSVYEDPQSVYVEADLPGLRAEDIDISLDKGVLSIRGERKEESSDKKYYKRSSSAFSYQVLVPGTVDENQEPEATYKEGVMKIAFKKAHERAGKKISIRTK